MKTRAEKQSLEIQAAAGRPKPEGVTTEKLIVMVHDELRASNPDLQDVVNALSFKYDMRVSSNDVARALRGEELEAGGPGSGPRPGGGSGEHHPIVQRALEDHVTNIGQLNDEEHKALDKAVKDGVLKKGMGGGYPKLKTVYAHPNFDIAGHHDAEIEKLKHAALMDEFTRQMNNKG
jgi:hypothetical protein